MFNHFLKPYNSLQKTKYQINISSPLCYISICNTDNNLQFYIFSPFCLSYIIQTITHTFAFLVCSVLSYTLHLQTTIYNFTFLVHFVVSYTSVTTTDQLHISRPFCHTLYHKQQLTSFTFLMHFDTIFKPRKS